jgi:hypothetical protein
MSEQDNITQEEGSAIANHGMMPEDKSDLFSRLNGESTLDFAIIASCERIMNDPTLEPFYRHFDMENLRFLQKEMLLFAIAKAPKNIDVNARISLRHYQLVDMGFNESHFDLQIGHLVAALEESWVEKEVIDDVKSCMGAFRVLFESSSGIDKKTMVKQFREAIQHEEIKAVIGSKQRQLPKRSSSSGKQENQYW